MALGLKVKIWGDVSELLTSMKRAEQSMARFGRNMQKVGKELSTAITLPLAIMGYKAAETFATFEQSMANVQAVSGATGAEFKRLQALALELGSSTRFTAAQVADLQLNYSKLGFIPSQIEKITGATLDLALASGSDLAQSATVAGATLRGFGLDAERMTEVTDVMAKSFSSSALDLEKFQTAMGVVAPVAKNANKTLQQTTAMLSVLVDRGVDASTAGTALRNIFLKLSVHGLTFEQAMQKIATASDKNAVAMELFGTRGATVAAILSENTTEAAKLTAKYNNSAGAAKAMATIMDATLTGAMARMRSAIEGMGIAFGKILAPTIKAVAGSIGSLVTWFKDLTTSQKKWILSISAIATALGPVLFLIGKMPALMAATLMGARTLIGAFTKLRALLVANPWLIAIAAIGAAAMALSSFTRAGSIADRTTERLNNTLAQAGKNATSELAALKLLIDKVKKSNQGTAKRAELISVINRRYNTTLTNLSSEKGFLDQINTAYSNISNSIKIKAFEQAKEQALTKLYEQRLGVMKKVQDFNNAMAAKPIQISWTPEDVKKSDLSGLTEEGKKMIPVLKGAKEHMIDLSAVTFRQSVGYAQYRGEIEQLEKEEKALLDLTAQQMGLKGGMITLTGKYIPLATEETTVVGRLQDEIKTLTAQLYREIEAGDINASKTAQEIAHRRGRIKAIEEEVKALMYLLVMKKQEAASVSPTTAPPPPTITKVPQGENPEAKSLRFDFTEAWNDVLAKSRASIAIINSSSFSGLFNAFTSVAGGISSALEALKSKTATTMEKIQMVAEAVASAATGVINAWMEISAQKHQEKMAQLDEYYNTETQRINESTMNEEQKEDAKSKLDKDYNKKKKELLREQAKDQKAATLIQAIISGALAVITALNFKPPLGFVFAAIVGALVAAQIALIASAPLPALATGGLAYGPTMALIGDNPGAILDPEVIAPLSRLQGMMGSGQREGALYGRLDGSDLLLSTDREKFRRERVRGD